MSSVTQTQSSDRVVIETRNVTTTSGKTVQISKVACSADALTSRSLEKRQVLDACDGSSVTLECVPDPGAEGPLTADCEELSLIATEDDESATFETGPGITTVISFETCEWEWKNSNAAGGPTLEYCFLDMISLANGLISCTGIGEAGGIAIPANFALDDADTWIFTVGRT